MDSDFAGLIHRDHDDLVKRIDRLTLSLQAAELVEALDAVRLGLFQHATAQDQVFRSLTGTDPTLVVDMVTKSAARDHVEQQAILDALAYFEPGGSSWVEWAIELRDRALDHAFRSDLLVGDLRRSVSSRTLVKLAGDYTAERRRMHAQTAPATIGRLARTSSL